jgi:hypothetical protein
LKKAYDKVAAENVVMALDKEELARFKEHAFAGDVSYYYM